MQTLRLVIFDLDGTLLDTISDLAHSTNYALEKNGFPAHPIESYKYFVGNGINMLFERSLPENERSTENITKVRADFIPYYDNHNTDFTKPYEGVCELLKELQSRDILLAVASNKYQAATEKLVSEIFSNIRFAAVLGQREGVPVKPDPAIIDDILSATNISQDETLYIGDSGVDMQTALNGGITSIGVTWGFRPREELAAYGACHIANSVSDILELLQIHKQ